MSNLSTWLLQLLGLVLLAGYVYMRWATRRLEKMSENFPGPPILPIIGNALDVGFNTVDFLDRGFKLCQQYEKLCRLWIGPKLYIAIQDPSDIEIILINPKYNTKAAMYNFIRPWLGSGLITAEGDKWHRDRKIITPTFHFKILEQFFDAFNAKSDILVKKLEKKSNGSSFDVFEFMTLYTLDTIAETAMGMDIKAQTRANSTYVTAVRRMGDYVVKRALRVWLYPDTIFELSTLGKMQRAALKTIHGTTRQIIKEKKMILRTKSANSRNEGDSALGIKKRVAFLDLLLEMNAEQDFITDEYMREEVDTFMAAGHETSSSSLSFTLYLLGNHQDIQDRVFHEISAIMGDENTVTPKLVNKMKCLDCVIKESLRLYPSVPVLGRELNEDTELTGNITLPAHCTVMIPIFAIHRNPVRFPNPDVFDPDRFLLERENPFSYIPFSAGSRNCIGQKYAMLQMKVPLIKILLNYKILPDESYQPILSAEMVLRSTNGVRIRMIPRHSVET